MANVNDLFFLFITFSLILITHCGRENQGHSNSDYGKPCTYFGEIVVNRLMFKLTYLLLIVLTDVFFISQVTRSDTRSILSIVIELISLAQTPIDKNKYGFRVSKNPNGYDWGK